MTLTAIFQHGELNHKNLKTFKDYTIPDTNESGSYL